MKPLQPDGIPLAGRLILTSNSNERMKEKPASLAVISQRNMTRERIIATAERLFMQQGFDGASMRQITAAAKVNLAAVNYHFGSKEALIQEVFRRRLHSLNQARVEALDALEQEANGKPIKPSKILDAFFGTLLRIAETEPQGGPTFLKLLGRTLTEPTEFIRAFLADEYQSVLSRYQEALFKALPNVPKAEIVWRFHFMLGATAYAIAGTDSLRLITDWVEPDEDPHDDLHRLIPRLMSFLVGGLRAPLPAFDSPEKPSTAKTSRKSPQVRAA